MRHLRIYSCNYHRIARSKRNTMPHLDEPKPQGSVADLLIANVTSFPSISQAGDTFARCFGSFGSNSKILLIGDASHGTSEFYAARAAITEYMIEHHGFNIVAVEADWPDAEIVDRYVRRRGRPGPASGIESVEVTKKTGHEPPFMRFPTWMWRNAEVQNFVEWLRDWNEGDDPHDAVGFYGLDLYSLGLSMRAVIAYLDEIDPEMADRARKRYSKLGEWAEDPHEYGLEALASGFKGYEREVLRMLQDLLNKRIEYASVHWDGEEFHGGEQNARLIKGT